MGTGYFDTPLTGDPDTDIQIREGYVGWATITPGDRTGCYVCKETVKVPVREFREIICGNCGTSQPAIAYFDMNGDFEDYLRKLMRTHVTAGTIRSANSEVNARKDAVRLDNAEYIARENAWKLYGNPRNISRIDWHALDVIT